MTILRNTQPRCILSITFNMRGFGYAVLDGYMTLMDWGVKVRAKDHALDMKKVKRLISLYAPTEMVLEDLSSSPFRRSTRIQTLNASLEEFARASGIPAKKLPFADVKSVFFGERPATKYEMAEELVKRFPNELEHLLPRKRLPWMTEHYRMGIFDAVALAAAFIQV